MKTIYKCEVCEKTHDSIREANQCENGHIIIRPTTLWFIPVLAWFIIPFHLFTKKHSIVIFHDNKLIASLISFWIAVSPFVIFLILLMLNIAYPK